MPDVSLRPVRQSKASLRAGLALAGFLAASYAAGAIGNAGMVAGDWMPWYEALEKPSWTPPGALIGAVWGVLYALMGVAAWLVWRAGGGWAGARVPLGLFAVQLALNAAWSVLFFGAKWMGVAFFELVALEAVLVATTVAFWRVRLLAGALLLPYVAWVAFAGFLNLAIWRMNV